MSGRTARAGLHIGPAERRGLALAAAVRAEQAGREADTAHWLARLEEQRGVLAEAQTREAALREERHALGAERDGTQDWVYIHIEIQGSEEGVFAKRMFVYNTRLFQRYDRPVASLAVLADDNPSWRPSAWGYELFGCRIRLEYPLVKLVDYEPRLEGLLDDPNPFALVTAAHLLTRRTRGDAEQRYAAKWRLARLLYERGWDRQRIIDLFAIIDWLMRLPRELENRLWQALVLLEESKTMPYVTSVERIGYERGLREGQRQGIRAGASALVHTLLHERFGALPEETEARLASLPPERIEDLGKALLRFDSLADLDAWLATH